MKQKDIILIIVVVFISAVVSYFLSGLLITSDKNRQEKVEVVEKISGTFDRPNSKYFNPNSNNPTKLIQIGDSVNDTPFNQ